MEPERETGQVRGAETGSILPVPDLPRCHPKIGGFNGYCQLKKPNFIVSSINVQIWLFIYHTWLPLFVSHLSLHPSPESGFHFPRQKKKTFPISISTQTYLKPENYIHRNDEEPKTSSSMSLLAYLREDEETQLEARGSSENQR